MNLSEIRQKYPQYDHLSDGELAQSLHRKYYPNMDWVDFSNRIGLVESAQGKEREKACLRMAEERKIRCWVRFLPLRMADRWVWLTRSGAL